MKHLLLAQTLALLLHGALFMVGFNGLLLQPARPLPREICVELVDPEPEARPQEAGTAPPRVEPQRVPEQPQPAAAPRTVRRPAKPPPRPLPAVHPQEEQPAAARVAAVATDQPAAERTDAAEQPAAASSFAAVTAQQVPAAAAGPPAAAAQAVAGSAPASAADILAAFPAPAAGGNRRQEQEKTGACPLYRQNPPPDYPPLARKRGLEGTVELDVLVGADGKADTVRLALTSGHDLLDRAAQAAVEKWLFEPGRKGEQTAAMWVRVPVRFALQQ
jgi:protein TonB